MSTKPKLTAQRLREMLDYEPETGVFTWLERDFPNTSNTGLVRWWNETYANQVAGSICEGYMRIGIEGQTFWAHRLACLYMTGAWPEAGKVVDHVDRNKSNNSWKNLRIASHRLNSLNIEKPHNPTGLTGVTPHRGRWKAQCRHKGKRFHLGMFDTPEEAHQAYLQKQRELPDSEHLSKADNALGVEFSNAGLP